jgi:peptidoglycan hydrolase-like protein with peptidoglycan-binding domain
MRTWTPLASMTTILLMATAAAAQIGSSSTVASPRTNEAHRDEVKQVQKTLTQKGHDPGPVDGLMGPQTRGAVKAFQKAHGLTATGELDASTLATLEIRGAASDRARGRPESDITHRSSPSQTQTGGDRQPSPADPAQANTTGGNVGEGASYSRSSEKPAPPPRPK